MNKALRKEWCVCRDYFWHFSAFLNCVSISTAPQQGQVDCWPLPCPPVDCEFTTVPEGECCPRCVTDPCQADTIRNDITKTCTDEHSISRFSGSSWIKHGTECTLCQCKVKWQTCRSNSKQPSSFIPKFIKLKFTAAGIEVLSFPGAPDTTTTSANLHTFTQEIEQICLTFSFILRNQIFQSKRPSII